MKVTCGECGYTWHIRPKRWKRDSPKRCPRCHYRCSPVEYINSEGYWKDTTKVKEVNFKEIKFK